MVLLRGSERGDDDLVLFFLCIEVTGLETSKCQDFSYVENSRVVVGGDMGFLFSKIDVLGLAMTTPVGEAALLLILFRMCSVNLSF